MKNKSGNKLASLTLAAVIALSNMTGVTAEEIMHVQVEPAAVADQVTSAAGAEYEESILQSYEAEEVNDVISINKTAYVNAGESIDDVYLKIVPQNGINAYDTITVSLSGGSFDKAATDEAKYVSGAGNSYESMMDFYESGMTNTQVLNSNLGEMTCELPYRFDLVRNNEATIELFPIDEMHCGQSTNMVAYDIPYYYIPLKVDAGDYDVSIRVEVGNTPLPDGFETVIAYVDGGTPAPSTETTTEGTTEEQDGIYPTDGGNIYYSPEGQITGCDPGIVNVVIPDRADGVLITGIADKAFYGCSSLESVYIPDSVLDIGYRAFQDCTALTEVRLSSDLISMDHDAFSGCTALKRIEIPYGVESIESHTFFNCQGLTEVVIPASVTSIDDRAFYGCTSLLAADLHENIHSIGSEAFYGCTSLSQVTVPDANIGYNAFMDCTGLTSAMVGCSVTGDSMFADCVNLRDVTFSDNLQRIENAAFSGCTSLTDIELPDSLTDIDDYAFADCASLTDIDISSNTRSVEPCAFYGCSSLTAVNVPEDNPWFTSVDGILFNKDKTIILQYPRGKEGLYAIPEGVTGLGEFVFRDNNNLTGITIPSTMTSLGDYSFWGCSALTEVNIPDSVTSIGYNAFADCVSLKEIRLPQGLTDLSYGVFTGCTSLTEVNIPEGLTTIPAETFLNCTSLADINIPGNITFIEWRAFGGCTALTEVVIPSGVTGMNSAFSDCTGLRKITFPDTLTTLEDGVLAGCTSLTSVEIPDGVTKLGATFYGCTALKDVKLPKNLQEIGLSVFYDCTSLEELTIPGGLTFIGADAFRNCNALTDIYFLGSKDQWDQVEIRSLGAPLNTVTMHYITYDTEKPVAAYPVEGGNIYYNSDGVITACDDTVTSGTIPVEIDGIRITYIGSDAFRDCSALEHIGLPAGLTGIGSYAFGGCEKLAEIMIPDSVTRIETSAFEGCSSLTEFEIPAAVTAIEDFTFRNCVLLENIVIPDDVTSIGEQAFGMCSSLKGVKIPAAVTEIGREAFECCEAIKTAGPAGGGYDLEFAWTEAIPDYAFDRLTGLTAVVLPEGITSIGNYAFWGCASLPEISIPESVAYIAPSAFSSCTGLDTVYVTRRSYGAQWALDNGYNVVFTGGPAFIYGDANYDDAVTASDAADIMQKVLDSTFETGVEANGGDYMTILDVNCDNGITGDDASQVMQKTLDNSYLMPCER